MIYTVRVCRTCGQEKAIDEFYKSSNFSRSRRRICKACVTARTVKWARENPDKVAVYKLKNRLRPRGFTLEQYYALWEKQHGLCALCGAPDTAEDPLCLDHNHKTEQVRGLLCRACNNGIGQLRDDPELCEKAANYLRGKKYEIRSA